MSNGYVRQSSAQIVTGLTANASDFNNEFNALQTTFDSSTGHNHDGTTGGGAPITLGGLATLAGLSVIGSATNATATPQALTGSAGQVLAVVGTALGFVSTLPGLTFSSAVTISSGGLGITAGGLVVKAGGITTGLTGTATGAINLVGATSGTITLQPQAAAGTYNWNYPTTAGTSGQVLASAGGVAAPMTWTTLAASATTDTTNAANISSGTLPAGRLPAFTGDATTVAGTAATTVVAINGVSLGSTVATAGNLLVGSGTQWVTRAMSGDATISSTGVITVGAGAITGAKIAATTVAAGNIVNNTITATQIANATITATQIANATITGTQIAATTVAGSNMVANTVTNTQLAQMATNTIKGNNTGVTANATDLTGDQLLAMITRPYLDVGLSSSTGILNANYQKCTFNSVNQDNRSWWDATNHRYTPQLAGRYKVTFMMTSQNGTSNTVEVVIATIAKNGSNVRLTEVSWQGVNTLPNQNSLVVVGILTMNGTTDYIEAFGQTIATDASNGFFSGGANEMVIEYVGP